MAHEVFISYASAEADVAEVVCAALEADGIACWMAPRDIRPGSEYAEQLVAAIRAARALVLVFSKSANDSEHVHRELDCAVSARLAVLPVRIENVQPSGPVEYCLAGRHWLDALGCPLEAHLEKLTTAVRDLLATKEAAPSAARPQRRKRASLWLVGAAVLVLAVGAALAVWALVSSKSPTKAGAAAPSAAGTSHTLTAQQIADKYGPGVARITVKVPYGVNGKLTWKTLVGSGFVIDKNGTILTNFTLLDRDPRAQYGRATPPIYWQQWATVELWGPLGQYSRVRGYCLPYDANIGAAFIAVDPKKVRLYPVPLGDAGTVRTGASVVTLGRQGWDVRTMAGRVSQPWSAANPETGNPGLTAWQVDGSFARPAIGGPVFDASGRVIGLMGPVPYVLTGGLANVLAINQCLSDLRGWTQMYWGGLRVWFGGVDYVYVGSELARTLGYPRTGELVELVDPDSASARAGLRGGKSAQVTLDAQGTLWQYLTGGDLIVALDGKPVTSDDRFNTLLGAHKSGETMTLRVLRGQRLLTVRVRLEAFPYVPPAA